MTGVDKIQEIRILKYHNGLSIREIGRRANVSTRTVQKILKGNKTKFTYHRQYPPHPATGKVRDIIEKWLREDLGVKKKYRRRATRIYELLKVEHGYTGSYESIARCVKDIKPRIKPEKVEVYIPLSFEPAEAFQFDWGEVWAFIGKPLVKLQLAVMILCHSRHFYARVYPCQKQELMLDAHRQAFEYFGGVCRRGIYDNMKSAVKRLLTGNHRKLQERFEIFCSHYLYKPDFCNPARGNEKGRVENLVGYVRRNFFSPFPHFNSIEELNERLMSFAISKAYMRKHPDIGDKNRYEVFEDEKKSFIHLPGHGFDCCRIRQAVVSTLSTVFFENNLYSVPTEYVSKNVQVKGYADNVVISHDGEEIARHKRLYTNNRHSYNPYHYLPVLQKKPRAIMNGRPFKDWQLPEMFNNYRMLLNRKLEDGDLYYARTLVLLKDWPIKNVVEAIKKSMDTGILGDSYILSLLRQRDNPIMEDKEYISIKIELSKYRAKQRYLGDYDDILRLRNKKEAEHER